MKRVLLTGATGFIGREMPALLQARGFEVHSIGRSPANPAEGVVCHRCDLLEEDSSALLREVAATHLLHLAWFAEPGKFWNAPQNLDWVAASLRLVRAFSSAGGRRVVIAGSCAEYDWSVPVLDERTTPLNPSTLYGEAKAGLFRLLEKASPVLGISLGWGRVFFPYGPYEKEGRLLSDLFDAAANRQAMSFSEGFQKRDYIHVEDTARAFALLLDGDVTGPVNIASGEIVAVRELVERGAAIAGGQDLVTFGTRPMQVGEPPVMAAATERLRNEVGFRPKFDLAAGLEDMFLRRRSVHEKGFQCE